VDFSLLWAGGPWTWIGLGLVLAGLELLAPGAFMLWLGMAAIGTGLVLFVYPLSWEGSAILFAILALAAVALVRWLHRRDGSGAGEGVGRNRAQMMIGRIFVLDGPIAEGRGRVKVDDTVWRVEGPDLPAGTHVRVTGTHGTLLKVKPVSAHGE
jgi:membrane protein implicated in regulation of membrane protease activity